MNFQEYASVIEFNYELAQRLRGEERALEERQRELREIYSDLLFKRPASFPTNTEALKVSELSSLMESFEKAGFVLPKERWIKNEFKRDYFEYELEYSNFFPIRDLKVYPDDSIYGSQKQVHTLDGKLKLSIYLEGKLSKKGKCISLINSRYYLTEKDKEENLLTSSSPEFPKYETLILKIEGPEIKQFAFEEHPQFIDSLESLVERKKVYFSFLRGGR